MDTVYELKIPQSIQRAKRLSSGERPQNGIVVIDNGSHELRAGYADDADLALRFPNQLIRPRARWSVEFETVVGESHFNVKGYDFGRAAVRSPFDSNVVVNFDTQEAILDYVLDRLGFEDQMDQECVVMTECLLNPVYTRETMLELLFEGYGFPKALLIPDALAAFYRNREAGKCGSDVMLTIMHIYSILSDPKSAARILDCLLSCQNWSFWFIGSLSTSHLHQLMMLHNPQCTTCLTKQIVEQIKEQCTICSPNYLNDLASIAEDQTRLGGLGIKVQFPKASPNQSNMNMPATEASSEKESDKASKIEENRHRLKTMLLKRKQKLIVEKEELLEYLKDIQQQVLSAGLESTVVELLEEAELKTVDELQKKIEGVAASLKRMSQPSDETAVESAPSATDEDIESVRLRYREVSDRLEQRKRGKYGLDKDVGLSSRRVSVQHRRRMKLVAEAAAKDDNDDFGADDRDWDVYKELDTHQPTNDNLDRRDVAELTALKAKLRKMGDIFEEATVDVGHSHMIRELSENQAFLTVERFRVPELLFQPSLAGVDQAGIAEIVSRVLKNVQPDHTSSLYNHLLLSGGNASYQDLPLRLEVELKSLRPYGHPMQIIQPCHYRLDAWYGAAQFAKNPGSDAFMVSMAEYEEQGGSRMSRKPIPFVYYM